MHAHLSGEQTPKCSLTEQQGEFLATALNGFKMLECMESYPVRNARLAGEDDPL